MNSAGFAGLFGLSNSIQFNQSSPFNPLVLPSGQSSIQNQYPSFNYFNRSSNSSSPPDKKIKVKRTRQRVDAGQPRNTYSSIPNYNQMRAMAANGSSSPSHLSVGSDISPGASRANIFGNNNSPRWKTSAADGQIAPGTFPQQNLMMNRAMNQMMESNLFNQQTPAGAPAPINLSAYDGMPTSGPFFNNMQMSHLLRFQAVMAANAAAEHKSKQTTGKDEVTEGSEQPEQSMATDLSAKTWHQNAPTPALSLESNDVTRRTEAVAAHKVKVEPNISAYEDDPSVKSLDATKAPSPSSSTVSVKSKRKQYQPQPASQMVSGLDFDSDVDDDEELLRNCSDDPTHLSEPPTRKLKLDCRNGIPLLPSALEAMPIDDHELKAMQKEIVTMQERYAQLLKARTETEISPREKEQSCAKSDEPLSLTKEAGTNSVKSGKEVHSSEIKSLGHQLKSELTTNVQTTVDKVLAQYLQMVETARASFLVAQQTAMQMQQQTSMFPNQTPHREWAESQRSLYLNYYNALTSYANAASGLNSLAAAAQSSNCQGIFPAAAAAAAQAGLLGPTPFSIPARAGTSMSGIPIRTTASDFSVTPRALDITSRMSAVTDQNNHGALPLMAKKKRSKVTDSRITKVPPASPHNFMGARLSVEDSAFIQTSLSQAFQMPPTMVPGGLRLMSTPQNTTYAQSTFGMEDPEFGGNSPLSLSDGTGSEIGSSYDHSQQTATLTPMHLRKAKLMFFYVRYPSSQLLKAFFSDIRFDKNNTAQLVKWFSNFREFYYIQMEKYARQALAEGVRSPDEITVSIDSELYRVLNVHYNRNNHIQFKVPIHFRDVVEATLREFFKSIQAGRDAEQSWKKAIYKIIARLDQAIPEYFKSLNFMEQLGFPDP